MKRMIEVVFGLALVIGSDLAVAPANAENGQIAVGVALAVLLVGCCLVVLWRVPRPHQLFIMRRRRSRYTLSYPPAG